MGSASSIEKRAPSGMMMWLAPHAPGPWAYPSAIAWPSAASASRSRCGDRTQRRRGLSRPRRRLREPREAGPASLRFLRSVASLPLSMCGSDRCEGAFLGLQTQLNANVKIGFSTLEQLTHDFGASSQTSLRD